MNFLKSVFPDDPEEEIEHGLDPDSLTNSPPPQDTEPTSSNQTRLGPNPNSSSFDDAGWSFGGLLKTISTRSESVLETYGRDLREFGSGLKKETVALKEAASRAVKDIPASIDVAQVSLETVGNVIDKLGNTVLKSTADIVSTGKDSFLTSDAEYDSSDNNSVKSNQQVSRFSARVHAIEIDSRTYCEEPEDVDYFTKWKSGFVLEDKCEEIEKSLAGNMGVGRVYKSVVPSEVNHETFWSRYFYKIHRLKQADDVRASLVQRAMSEKDDEDLKWDNDEESDEDVVASMADSLRVEEIGVLDVQQQEDLVEKTPLQDEGPVEDAEKMGESSEMEKVSQIAELGGGKNEGRVVSASSTQTITSKDVNPNENSVGESSKASSDLSVISMPSSLPGDDDEVEWDEIEDLGGTGCNEGGSTNRAVLHKRLSTAAEDEDLSWDVEEEDEEPTKTA